MAGVGEIIGNLHSLAGAMQADRLRPIHQEDLDHSRMLRHRESQAKRLDYLRELRKQIELEKPEHQLFDTEIFDEKGDLKIIAPDAGLKKKMYQENLKKYESQKKNTGMLRKQILEGLVYDQPIMQQSQSGNFLSQLLYLLGIGR